MNVENILAVADAIEAACAPEAKPEIGFNMSLFCGPAETAGREDRTGHHCGTVGCIVGWANFVAHRPRATWKSEDHAAAFLGLEFAEADDLFFPSGFAIETWGEISAEHTVAVLRHLAATGEVNWTVGASSPEAS